MAATAPKTDFHYTIVDGAFIRLVPNTPEAVETWNANAAMQGLLPRIHLGNIRLQMKAAGYTLRKSRPAKATVADDAKLLAALGVE